jgi:hypothetical protein
VAQALSYVWVIISEIIGSIGVEFESMSKLCLREKKLKVSVNQLLCGLYAKQDKIFVFRVHNGHMEKLLRRCASLQTKTEVVEQVGACRKAGGESRRAIRKSNMQQRDLCSVFLEPERTTGVH